MELNDDVLSLIIDKFDVKTLLKLRLVSKQWEKVISKNLTPRTIYSTTKDIVPTIFNNFDIVLYNIKETEYYSEDGDYIHEITYTIKNNIIHREFGPDIIRRFLVDENITSFCPYIEYYWYKHNDFIFMHKYSV
jgi:hypothetical protein